MSEPYLENLSAVPSTLLIPLVARAKGPQLFPQLKFSDPQAERMLKKLKHPGQEYLEDLPSIYGCMERCQIFIERQRDFFKQHPFATGINLGCGLSDYFQWSDNGKNHFVDFDLPEVIKIRSQLLKPKNHRQRFVSGSLTDSNWWEQLDLSKQEPVFMQSEGVFMYLKPDQVVDVLITFARNAPVGSRFVFDHMCWLAIGKAKKHPSVKKTKAEFYWGLRKSDDLNRIHSNLKLHAQYKVMESYGLLYSLIGPIFKTLFKVPIYGVSELHRI